MKLLITSDVHGDIDILMHVINKHQDVTFHINAGDMSLPKSAIEKFHIISVKGNNDFGSDLPYIRVFEIENLKIMLTHGHLEHVKLSLDRLIQKAKENQVNLCIYGHTHMKESKHIDGITFINPGALSSGSKSYCIYENEKITFYQR
jgi:uncharacterized protein